MKIQSADIFIDIIDNYGDMGWVLEFLLMNCFSLSWSIVTNDPAKMQSFLENSGCTLPPFKIIEKKQYTPSSGSDLMILGLHAEIDLEKIPEGKNIIRVNYLTFDPWYKNLHNREHILSSLDRPIREIAYSPLANTGGLWKYNHAKRSRQRWLSDMNIDGNQDEKIWIPFFCYKETLQNFDGTNIPENVVIFLIGNSLEYSFTQKNILHFPWMKRDDFWDLIDLGDISILRGEISSARGLRSGKPYIWDMYKELGGWNEEESEGFLDFIQADTPYRNLHKNINTGKIWSIEDILDIYEQNPSFHFEEIPDFQETLENTLDSFGFSL